MHITGLYRVQVSENYRFLPQRFNTYRGPKQGKPGRNQNSSPGLVLVSKDYRFVKQSWLVNITGLYRVQVSGKVPVFASAFQLHRKDIYLFISFPCNYGFLKKTFLFVDLIRIRSNCGNTVCLYEYNIKQ